METILNKDFYPTPLAVIEKMLTGVEIEGKIVLEPSAGSGNIVDYLNQHGAKRVVACELSEKLRKTLSGKCNIIAEDFLTLQPEQVSHIDLIVMNPPFSADDKHILHAFEIAPGGCEIIALCNTETLRSRYSTSRKEIFGLIRENGFSDDLGSCFADSERSTDVEVSCIYLHKPKTGEEEFDNYFSMSPDEEQQGEGLRQYNVIRDLVNRYVDAVKRYDTVMQAADGINALTKPFETNRIRFGAHSTQRDFYGEITRDYFKKQLQKSAWTHIFKLMNMGKYVTSGVMADINRFVERQEHIPFTMHNVYRMLEVIAGTQDSRMKQVVVEAFDHICSFSAENSTAGEKWKTNSDYMINRRFIVPFICDYDARWSTDNVRVRWDHNRERINDIDKALCYLTGTNYDTHADLKRSVEDAKMAWGQWYEWSFFRIRGYKKGTMHFEFLREEDWIRFNTEVAKIKGWQLPKQRKTA